MNKIERFHGLFRKYIRLLSLKFVRLRSQQLRRHGVRVVYNYADTRSSRISSRKQKKNRETCFFCFYLGPR